MDRSNGARLQTQQDNPAGHPKGAIHELIAYFLRLGSLGFGGPVALCGLMEKELVQDRGWLSRQEMRDAIAVSSRSPGRWRSRSAF